MKKLSCFLIAMLVAQSSFALELVCTSDKNNATKRQYFYVDCASQKDLLKLIDSALKEMSEQGVSSNNTAACEGAYQDLQKLSKLPTTEQISKQYLKPCNEALRHLK